MPQFYLCDVCNVSISEPTTKVYFSSPEGQRPTIVELVVTDPNGKKKILCGPHFMELAKDFCVKFLALNMPQAQPPQPEQPTCPEQTLTPEQLKAMGEYEVAKDKVDEGKVDEVVIPIPPEAT